MLKGRLEAELEEILRKAQMPPRRRRPRRRWRLPKVRLPLSPSALLWGGVVALVGALVARGPLSGWAVWLFAAGLLLLVAAYASYWVRRGNRVEKRWRGRPVDTSPRWWEHLRHPFRR